MIVPYQAICPVKLTEAAAQPTQVFAQKVRVLSTSKSCLKDAEALGTHVGSVCFLSEEPFEIELTIEEIAYKALFSCLPCRRPTTFFATGKVIVDGFTLKRTFGGPIVDGIATHYFSQLPLEFVENYKLLLRFQPKPATG